MAAYIRKFTDEELKEQQRVRAVAYNKSRQWSAETLERMSNSMKQYWESHPEFRDTVRAANIGRHNSPESYRRAAIKRTGLRRSAETKHKQSIAAKRSWKKTKTARIAAMTGKKKPDGFGAMVSARQKKRWQDSNYQERFLKKWFAALAMKPNKTERRLGKLLNKILPGQYKFVGNGKVLLGRKCPDFINVNGQKKIIELFGDYWHRGENPQHRIDYFKRYGYDTLVIWESEFNKEQALVAAKIAQFNGVNYANVLA